MFPITFNPLIIFAIAFVLVVALTYAVREFAHRINFVAKPKSDRWHKRPTAMLGGIAIFLTTAIVYLLFLPQTTQTWVVMAGSAFLFLVGLIDDRFHIKPY